MIQRNSDFSQFYKPKNKNIEIAENNLREVVENRIDGPLGTLYSRITLTEYHDYRITDFNLTNGPFKFIYEPLTIARRLNITNNLKHFFKNETLNYKNTLMKYGLVPELNILSMKLINVEIPDIFDNEVVRINKTADFDNMCIRLDFDKKFGSSIIE